MSKSAEMTLAYETDLQAQGRRALATVNHRWPISAPSISSGSFPTIGMVIAPCSIKTMSEIATGVTARCSRARPTSCSRRSAAGAALRETPLHGGHLRTMTTLSDIGAVVAPIVPAFYTRPKTVDDIINHTCGRLLTCRIETKVVKRWQGRTGGGGVRRRGVSSSCPCLSRASTS